MDYKPQVPSITHILTEMPRQASIAEIRLNQVSGCLAITRSSLELLAGNLKISGLEAILNTTQSLLKLAQTIKQNRNACNELMEQVHQLLNAIIVVYIKSDTGAELAPSVLNHIAKFAQTLHKIHAFIEAQQGGNKITNILSDVKQMEDLVEARHQEVLDMIETLSSADSASLICPSSNSISMLPAEPKIFHGREAELIRILKSFDQGSPRIAILGAGGMGKTSLSRAVLHHTDITTKYQDNRFFVACDGSRNRVELAGVIGAHLGLKPGKNLTQGVLRHLSSAPPTLLILDNLETLWDQVETRKEIEDFLSLLTEITHLALIITMRGAERPSKVLWTQPFLMPLQPLAQNSAREMFLDIADEGHSMDEVDQVLRLTDNMPLAISLLAHLVDTDSEGCSKILSRWETEKTSLLSEGHDSRSNLEISILLSLSSPRITSMPHCQDLLALLSILPDGLSDVELKQTNFPIENILGCKVALLRTALAYTDEHQRIKVLVPIREYMQRLLAPTDQMIRPLLNHFQDLLEFYREHSGMKSSTLIASKITSNFSNIQNILQNGLKLGHPDLIVSIYCTCHLNRFSGMTGGGDIALFDLIIPMLPELSNPALEVYVTTETFGPWRSVTSHAKELESRAQEQFDYFDDPNLKCRFHTELANYYLYHNQDISMSTKHAQIALSLAQATGNSRSQSYILMHFSFTKWSLGDYIAAQVYVRDAQKLARRSGDLYTEARGLRLEAGCWQALGNYTQCISLLDRGRALLNLSGLSHSYEEHSIQTILGEVHQLKSEYVEAHSIHNRNIQAGPAGNTPHLHGLSLLNIANIEISMGVSKHEIQKKLDASQTIFKVYGSTRLSTSCDCIQADLNLREGDMSTSVFLRCLGAVWGNNSELVSYCLERLGDTGRWEGSDHDPSWSTVFLAYSLKQKEKLEIHKALQFIGDIFFRENDEFTATSLFTLALQGFTQMDVHRSRAECMIRLGDISEKNGNLLKALELWDMARPLFERSSQTKQVQAIDERLARMNEDVKEQHQQNLTSWTELSYAPDQEMEEEDDLSEAELEFDGAVCKDVVG
ncbi:hypothetical protein C8F04DRAFT_1321883 [Mycena alexandri]|uniref:Novel STAND NTPase 1 domain-containing protein n=1 Tax=Mycena alexandri TaxID=1745969 RepID=A0AAD6S1F7_9AGAR|nr:hypothetical protein C8F04DRAFT_1321883 [Mycena alexandri]